MNVDRFWWLVVPAFLLGGFGCRLVETPEEDSSGQSRELSVPEGFRVSNLEMGDIQVEVRAPDGLPYEGALVHLLDARGRSIESRPTDRDGVVVFRAASPEGVFLVSVAAVGVASDTVRVAASLGRVVLPRAAILEPPGGAARGLASARTASWSLVSANSLGLPAGIDSSRRSEVTAAFLSDVNYAFPESRRIPLSHPEYLQQGAAEEILMSDSGEMWLTFLHEGAGYRNSFGYYVVPPRAAVSSVGALDKRILFPNASLRGSGGGLVAGDRVRVGAFPAGTRIGFFVVADGWNGSRVDTSGAKPMYFSRDALNPETDPSRRRHLALLLHQGTGRAVMGFEDINRMNSGCDEDFNDALFTVTWNPPQAVAPDQFVPLPGRTDSDNDGVADNLDEFPTDPLRAFTRWFPARETWGTLAYEDLWPSSGDYDFNDLVARYNVREVRSANLSATDVEMKVVPQAAGASLRGGLGVGFGRLATAPRSVEVLRGAQARPDAYRRDAATGEVVVRLTTDFLGGFRGTSGGMVNTRAGAVRYASDTLSVKMSLATPTDLAEPPYDPFLFRAADTTHEVHLPDRAPTRAMKRSLFRTRDDKTDSVKGSWYRDATRLPWGLNLAEEWAWPVEGARIQDAYPRFSSWVASGGRSDLDWYLQPVEGRVIRP